MGTRRAGRTVAVGLLVGCVLLVLLRAFVVEVDRVSSPSMAPTLLVGDRLLVDRLGWRRHGPARGDVIVFRAPDDSANMVKRIVGLPGDEVEDDGARWKINGTPVVTELLGEVSLTAEGDELHRPIALPERTLQSEQLGSHRLKVVRLREGRRPGGRWQVPAGALFVLGDNRDASVDSRDEVVGLVPVSSVVGRVTRVMFSRATAGWRSRNWMPVP